MKLLYGYIPYEMAVELVDCSGEHGEYRNNAKICILKNMNIRKGCKSAYEYCVNHASNTKRKSYVSQNRPEGYPPCTKQIINILMQQENNMLERGKLRRIIIQEIGYLDTTFRSAIQRLQFDGRIHTEGSALSKYQKIKLGNIKSK